MRYAILEISGRQYLVKPGQATEIDRLSPKQGGEKTLVVDKVLLMADKDEVEIGMPYLKKQLKFEILDEVKKSKIRVATYKAKSNSRRVIGLKPIVSKIRLIES